MTYFIRQKFFSLGATYNVLDESQKECFKVSSKIFSFGYKGEVLDLYGNSLVQIEQEVFHFLPHYNIIKNFETVGRVKKEFTFFQQKFTIESSYGEFTIEGDFLALDFKIYKGNNEVATISKTFFSLTDFYQIDVTDEILPEFSIALVIIVDNILYNNRGSSSASFSNS